MRVQVFDPRGRYLTEWSNLIVPWTLWMSNRDELYVCGSSPMRWASKLPLPGMVLGVPPKDQIVMKIDLTGRLLSLWTFPKGSGPGSRPGELDWAHAIAVGSRGDLFLGDIQGCRAQRFRLQEREAADPRPGRGGLADRPAKRDEAVQQATTP